MLGGQDEIGRVEMAATMDEYNQKYQQAVTAYTQGNYDIAAKLVDQVAQSLADDPNAHLLRGHIYYVLQRYDIAQSEYGKVLHLTDDDEIIGFATSGLENIHQHLESLGDQNEQVKTTQPSYYLVNEEVELPDLDVTGDLSSLRLDSKLFAAYESVSPDLIEELSLDKSPFDLKVDLTDTQKMPDPPKVSGDDPFTPIQDHSNNDGRLPAFWHSDIGENGNGNLSEFDLNSVHNSLNTKEGDNNYSPFMDMENRVEPPREPESELTKDRPVTEVEPNANQHQTNKLGNGFGETPAQTSTVKQSNFGVQVDDHHLDEDDIDFEAFESAFGAEALTADEPKNTLKEERPKANTDFLDDFDEFDDLGNIPGFEIEREPSFNEVVMLSGSLETKNNEKSLNIDDSASDREEELFTITSTHEAITAFNQPEVQTLEPNVSVEQGWQVFFENASLEQKPLYMALGAGVVSFVVGAIVSFGAMSASPPEQRVSVRNTSWAIVLAAGIAGGATAGFIGNHTLKKIRRSTKNLQNQFDAIRQGNFNVQATIYSKDELGYLATSFNEMSRVIFTTTNEAQRKAAEQEEAKENLQRQVIRLLDDVEGAARGDLTVQAEVTADVLGAVADAFNLTIQNLRDIVQQVTVAAKEVTKGSTNSETFARALSSDALRQAEELAVTLNSVQVMTDSIQRVAEAAREAESVARDASRIAIKGGEAVENTVAGILEIRETVAETTRKVKRLAESSQEISKIVALISQIASRTNLLALNASIEAARAGEAGRGFAIVADEVRQLADKSAKSLKEIEQIVMQIQSETGSVMTAMEEGTQQVIKGTKLAEEAKRSLENIIQVANRIDILVRSITNDTVEQTDTSRAVAQVMQSVELTAQETSQEAQRVSGALQHLVGVSRDLIASVERFRVDVMESR